MLTKHRSLLFVGALLSGACEPPVTHVPVRTPGAEEASAGTFGLFTLVAGGDGTVALSGQFFEYRGIARERALGALSPTINLLNHQSGEGRCRVVAPEAAPVRAEFQIDLLDAGVLHAFTPWTEQAIGPRRFPDALPEVSGVIYVSAEDRPLPYAPEVEYVLRGDGGSDVGRFEVRVGAPSPLAPEDLLLPPPDAPMEITWGEGDPESDFAHILVAEGDTLVSCITPDTGHLTIPEAVAERLPGGGEMTVTVRRVRSQAFTAPGIPTAELVFIVQRSRSTG